MIQIFISWNKNLAAKQLWHKHRETFEKCISVQHFLRHSNVDGELCAARGEHQLPESIPSQRYLLSLFSINSAEWMVPTLPSCNTPSLYGCKAKLMALHSLPSACIYNMFLCFCRSCSIIVLRSDIPSSTDSEQNKVLVNWSSPKCSV